MDEHSATRLRLTAKLMPRLRKEAQLTMADLAGHAELSEKTIWRIENGEAVSDESLRAIGSALSDSLGKQINLLDHALVESLLQEAIERSRGLGASVLQRLSDQMLRESGEIADDRGSLVLQDLYVTRDCETSIIQSLRDSKNPIFVTGAAGCGKTSTLWRIAQRLLGDGAHVLFLRADLIASDDGFRELQAAPHSSDKGAYVIIDTVDAIAGSAEHRLRFETILDRLQEKGYSVLASIRHFEKHRYFTSFKGIEIPAVYSENEFPRAIESHVKAFYRLKDTATIAARIDEVKAIVAGASPVVELAYQPLTLRMLFSIYQGSEIPAEINALSLYLEFWRRRVETDWRAGRPDPEPNSRSLANCAAWLADKMFVDGAIQVGRDSVNIGVSEGMILSQDISDLLARGILRSVSSTGEHDGVEFFHQTFFEFSAAWAINSGRSRIEIEDLHEHLKSNQFDSMRIPVLQHALALGNLSTAGASAGARVMLTEILQSQPEHLIGNAIFVAAQLPSLDLAIEDALVTALRNRTLSSLYVRAAPSIPLPRLPDTLSLFQTLYLAERAENPDRNPRAVRFAVVKQLPRLVGRMPELAVEVLRFLDENHVIEDLTPIDASGLSHSTTLEVENVAALLFETSRNEPDRSSAVFMIGCRRLSDRSQARNASLLKFIVAFCHSEHISRAVLQDALTILSGIDVPKIERIRAFLEARLWDHERQAPYSFEFQHEMTDLPHVLLIQCWSRGRLVAVWEEMWDVFCGLCETQSTNKQLLSLWCREIWCNLDKHPLEPSAEVSFRAYDFLAGLLAEGLISRDHRQRFAAGQVCAYANSQSLLAEVFLRIRDDGVALSENAAVEDAFIPAIIGLSEHFDSSDARFSQIFKRKSARNKLIGAAEHLLILRHDLWGGLTDFLVEHRALHRLAEAVATGRIKPRPLSTKASRDLAEHIKANLSTEDVEERRRLARVMHLGLADGLELQLDPQLVFHALSVEVDSKVRAWLAMSAAEVATERDDIRTSLSELLSVVANGDKDVRDRATTCLVKVLGENPPYLDVDRFLESISTKLNLRMVCEAARLVGAISATQPIDATYIGKWLIMGEPSNGLGKTILASFRTMARYPLMIWFRSLPANTALEIINAIPNLDDEIAVLVADLALHSQYRDAFAAALDGFLQADDLNANLARILGNLIRSRVTSIRPLQVPSAARNVLSC